MLCVEKATYLKKKKNQLSYPVNPLKIIMEKNPGLKKYRRIKLTKTFLKSIELN